MFNWLKKLFTHSPAIEIALDSVADYERKLLACQAHASYYEHMTQYYQEGIDRLNKKLSRG